MIETALPKSSFSILRGEERTRAQREELIQAAIGYRQIGWSIIPVRGKDAAVDWKPFQVELMSKARLIEALSVGGVTGIAVVLGRASGMLYCRDFDSRVAYENWAASN